MTRKEIKEELTILIVDKLGVEPKEVTEEARLREDLGADSLDEVELIIDSERVFATYNSDEEYEHIHTVGQAIDLWKRKLSEK